MRLTQQGMMFLYENIALFLYYSLVVLGWLAFMWYVMQKRRTERFERKSEELERISMTPESRSSYPWDGAP